MIKQIVGPIARRLGTLVGGMLVGLGATVDEKTAIVNGVVALLLFVADLAMSRLNWFR